MFEGRYKFSMPTPTEADSLFMQIPYYAEGSLRTWAEAVKRDALQAAGLGGARLVEVSVPVCVPCVLVAYLRPK